jgi:hypothetical protein
MRKDVKSRISDVAWKALGSIIGLAVVLLVACIVGVVLRGAVWLGEVVLPWLIVASVLVCALCVLVLGPLAAFRRTRGWAGLGLVIASYVFGATGWFLGLLLTWVLWGPIAVFVGLFLLGVGVVPIAMLATLIKGMWLELALLVVVVVFTFGCRVLGVWLAESAEV